MVKEMIGVDARIGRLPVDSRGYPVPKFVAWIDGKPDFRVMDPDHMVKCVRQDLCWICGEKLGGNKAFVIGPMCVVNRISSEPPSHLSCAHFAVMNCPFLNEPRAKRRKASEIGVAAAGVPIPRNPGVSAIWVTRDYKVWRAPGGNDGVLFRVGTPKHIQFYANSRVATEEEVQASILSGLPLLIASCEGDRGDLLALKLQVKGAYTLIEMSPEEALKLLEAELV